MKNVNLLKRLDTAESQVGAAAGLPPCAIEDDKGMLHIPDHEPMTREEFETLVEPWDKIGIPAIVISHFKSGKRTRFSPVK